MELINAITIYTLAMGVVAFLFFGVPYLIGKHVESDCEGYDCIDVGIRTAVPPTLVAVAIMAAIVTLAGLVNFVR